MPRAKNPLTSGPQTYERIQVKNAYRVKNLGSDSTVGNNRSLDVIHIW